MKDISIKELKNTATQMRMKVIDMIYKAQSGHPGGSLSAADFVTACYFKYMNIDPKDPRWPDRDRMVLSKGHVCPIQYACLASVGFFPESELDTLRKEGSMLQGHPSMNRCPGIDISTGSLGQGLACAVGMAMAGKMDHKDYKVFCVVGDGEAQEGEIWEAANTAHKYGLDNLIVFVDYNNLQLDGTCDEIMPNGDLGEKFKASAGRRSSSTAIAWKRSSRASTSATPPRTASPSACMPTPSRARVFPSWKTSVAGTALPRMMSSTRRPWLSSRPS